MLIPVDAPLDLESTIFSGQAFRWRRQDPWLYGVVFNNIVKLRRTPSAVEFFSSPDDESVIRPLLADYLGLDVDLERVYESFGADERIRAATAQYRGMRILRQDPWECLVSFICSSASNIPRISGNIEDLCTTYGRALAMGDYARHTFPTLHDLAEAEEQEIRDLRLGYRAAFIVETARAISDGKVDLMSLREDSYEGALEALIGLPGVGDKVANCAILFSLDKPEAFPVDVWINRALQEWYLDGRDEKLSLPKMRLWAQEYFGPYAGYANQYLFHSRRLQGRPRGASAPGPSLEASSPKGPESPKG